MHAVDAYINCLLSICCPPEQRYEVFVKFMVEYGVEAKAAEQCATVILSHFDLAPKDTMQPLIQAVATLARGAKYKP